MPPKYFGAERSKQPSPANFLNELAVCLALFPTGKK